MTLSTLESQQADFAAALIDAHAEPRAATLLANPEVARARLRLHRGNIADAQASALDRAFPVVHALVGDEYFAGLCAAYGRAHPSAGGDLRRHGESLPAFVGGIEKTASLPYLRDVATLEWAVHRAYFAADATPATPARIAALSPSDLLAERFAVQPACAWVVSRFPIATIWQAHQRDRDIALPDGVDRAETALVMRPLWRVDVRISSAAEVLALAAFRAGADMNAAIEAGLAADAAFDFAHALVCWLDEGLLTERTGGHGERAAADAARETRSLLKCAPTIEDHARE
jgi:uncharacterized protein